MLPRKIFKNLHTVMAILVLLKQFLRKDRHNLGPKLCVLHQLCVLFTQFWLCVLKATTAYCYEEVQNHGKILFIRNIVENGWWGDAYAAYPTSPLCFKLKISKAVIKHDCCKEVKGMLSCETGKTIFKC